MTAFLELTVVSDTADTLAKPRKVSVRVDTITSFSDISSGGFAGFVKTSIILDEPTDFINDDDNIGGVVAGRRSLAVQEDYEKVKSMISEAGL